LKLMPYHLK